MTISTEQPGFVASIERASMRIEAGIFGEQGWVDIQHPPAPLLDEPRGEDAHEAGKRDGPDAGVVRMALTDDRRLRASPLLSEDQVGFRAPSPIEPSAAGLFDATRTTS